LALLWELAHIFESKLAVQRLDALERSLEWAQAAAMDLQRVRYFCPIWQDKTASGQPWWMTFNRRTYSHDLLEILGGENIARDRERRYPLEADLGLAAVEAPAGRDTRYPRMTMEEIRAGEPELVLLPDEPYPFQETHRLEWLEALAGCPVVEKERIHCIAGSLVTWHGTRLARALEELPLLIMKG
jgi:ABC-type Fe3+-hydroxamate transport system substrate-binding protein